ncbi:hypothetical protein [Lentzea waywayandensis]|uniref:hypothetical protein n=1 Tax=Lentzea waywayandensis TaxID=84724 RepID=UPI0015A6C89F|nr:hypothetical protein [Lentzea waywayandensis]
MAPDADGIRRQDRRCRVWSCRARKCGEFDRNGHHDRQLVDSEDLHAAGGMPRQEL